MSASTKIGMPGMSILAIVLASLGLVPSSVQPAVAKDKNKADIFSTPDTKQNSPPGFKNRPPLPISPNALGLEDGEMPNQDILSNLPSLTEEQRKQVRRYCDESRTQNQFLADQLRIFETRLKELTPTKNGKTPAVPVLQAKPVTSEANSRKGASSGTATGVGMGTGTGTGTGTGIGNGTGSGFGVVTGASPTDLAMVNQVEHTSKLAGTNAPTLGVSALPPPAPSRFALLTQRATEEASHMSSPDQAKAKVADLKQAMKDNASNLTAQVCALLSADQLAQFQAMRRGTLVINGETTASVQNAQKR